MNVKFSKHYRMMRLQSGFTKAQRFTIEEFAKRFKISYSAANQRMWRMQKLGMIACKEKHLGGGTRKYWFT